MQCILCMQLDDRDIMLKHKCVQVHRADSHEPYGWKGQVEILKISPFFFSFVGKKRILLTRFEWPNGDKYIGQYINGKRNGLGDMQVVLIAI